MTAFDLEDFLEYKHLLMNSSYFEAIDMAQQWQEVQQALAAADAAAGGDGMASSYMDEALAAAAANMSSNETLGYFGVHWVPNPLEMLSPWAHNPWFTMILVVYSITLVVGLMSNMAAIASLKKEKKKHRNAFLISSLSADMILLGVGEPLQVASYFVLEWDRIGIVCKAAVFIDFLTAVSVVMNLTAVSLERFLVIAFPLQSRNWCSNKNSMRGAVLIWMISAALALPNIRAKDTVVMTYASNDTFLQIYQCLSNEDVNLLSVAFVRFLILFIFPSVVMATCYGSAIRHLWRSSKIARYLTNQSSRHTNRSTSQQECEEALGRLDPVNNEPSVVVESCAGRLGVGRRRKSSVVPLRLLSFSHRLDSANTVVLRVPAPNVEDYEHHAAAGMNHNADGENGKSQEGCEAEIRNKNMEPAAAVCSPKRTSGAVAAEDTEHVVKDEAYVALTTAGRSSSSSDVLFDPNKIVARAAAADEDATLASQEILSDHLVQSATATTTLFNHSSVESDSSSSSASASNSPSASASSSSVTKGKKLETTKACRSVSERSNCQPTAPAIISHAAGLVTSDLNSPTSAHDGERMPQLPQHGRESTLAVDNLNQVTSSPSGLLVGGPAVLMTTSPSAGIVGQRQQMQKSTKSHTEHAGPRRARHIINTRRRLKTMLMAHIVLFMVCWGPRLLWDVAMYSTEDPSFSPLIYVTRVFLFLLPFVHAAINPLLYFCMSSALRTAFWELATMRRGSGNNNNLGPGGTTGGRGGNDPVGGAISAGRRSTNPANMNITGPSSSVVMGLMNHRDNAEHCESFSHLDSAVVVHNEEKHQRTEEQPSELSTKDDYVDGEAIFAGKQIGNNLMDSCKTITVYGKDAAVEHHENLKPIRWESFCNHARKSCCKSVIDLEAAGSNDAEVPELNGAFHVRRISVC